MYTIFQKRNRNTALLSGNVHNEINTSTVLTVSICHVLYVTPTYILTRITEKTQHYLAFALLLMYQFFDRSSKTIEIAIHSLYRHTFVIDFYFSVGNYIFTSIDSKPLCMCIVFLLLHLYFVFLCVYCIYIYTYILCVHVCMKLYSSSNQLFVMTNTTILFPTQAFSTKTFSYHKWFSSMNRCNVT